MFFTFIYHNICTFALCIVLLFLLPIYLALLIDVFYPFIECRLVFRYCNT